ncbi:MAG: hypothetical protein M1816_006951 [Peltula sp. TS41687]|nr:MAG: hypothetical protein M1816_006951 [Peltula sp. TS41687]
MTRRPIARNSKEFSTGPPSSHPPLPNPSLQPTFKLDEGYSEETRSQAESDSALQSPSGVVMVSADLGIPAWITSLGETDRSELAYMILRSLRTSSVAAIVDRLHPLLHLDPIAFLPPELTFQIFSYLNPQALLVASVTSQAWRTRAVDTRLWRCLYYREGWAADYGEVRRFEQELSLLNSITTSRANGKARMARSAAEDAENGQRNKKRIPETGVSLGLADSSPSFAIENPNFAAALGWRQQHDTLEADEFPRTIFRNNLMRRGESQDEEMKDVDAQGGIYLATNGETDSGVMNSVSSGSSPPPFIRARSNLHSRLTVPSTNGERKLNWHHLFKQRRRLEDNWNAGRYINFQLPHPDHPEEAHRECIYTIQYSGRYLVSGSRDRTIRIWNLDTMRLVRGPLTGHGGSVLCLQFDADEDEDTIISGSSDTDVIVWKFSTGEQIKKIRQAHKESVLNLKYDKRYLVTCSKDKNINVWNRQHLDATSPDFPVAAVGGDHVVLPQYVLSIAAQASLIAEDRLGYGAQLEQIQPYSFLMSLRGHNAAVNAIQVLGDQVVSASGDRNIKVWNLRTGLLEATIPGHNKGIACVQYDGRRIVSGSSDNTVKIFDRSGAEVACLVGHQDLVRTVQAGFGDVPGGEDDEQAEAKATDLRFYEARDTGRIVLDTNPRSKQSRNAGSRDPDKITAFGASLPPGGGGSRWGRIVSGSYDETIIIWKRDSEGKWVVGHKLLQEEAAKAAGGTSFRATGMERMEGIPTATGLQNQVTQAAAQQLMMNNPYLIGGYGVAANVQAAPNLPVGPGYPQFAQPSAASAYQLEQHIMNVGTNNSLLQMAINQQQPQQQATPSTAGINPQQVMNPTATQNSSNSTSQPTVATSVPTTQPPIPQGQPQAQQQQQQQPPYATMATAAAAAAAAATMAAMPQALAAAAAAAGGNANARVFKLQFDARRIICCSQDPRIFGWDFANGDEEIMEASRFFGGL